MDDKKIDELIKPIIDIYDSLELELIKDIALRFDNYNTIGGTLEWRLKKLDELGSLNKSTIKLISKYSKKSEEEILQMLYDAQKGVFDIAYYQKAYEKGIITIDPLKIVKADIFDNIVKNTYKEINETFRLIHTKALESTKKAYIDVLNETFVSVSSGIYDYNTAIKKALVKMAKNGIKGATYERKDGTIVQYSLQGTVKRDIVSAIIQTTCASSMTMCKELNAEYVEVTSHIGARTGDGINPISNHAHWQGKVYKLHGSNNEYKNFYEETGYGDILGLGGVNCRHNFYPFFPGIDKPSAIQYDEEENRKEYEKQQKKNRLERRKQQLKRIKEVAEHTKDKKLEKETIKNIELVKKELYNIDDIDVPDFMKQNDVANIINELKSIVPENIYKYADVTIEKHDKNYSVYKLNDKKILLGNKSDVYDLIHELGHRIDIETNLFNNNDFLNIINNKFSKYTKKDFELVKHKTGKYYRLKNSTNFVSKYQTRIYYGGFNIFGKIKVDYAREYFSEGLKYYYKDPELLKEKDIELFNFIKSMEE